MIVYSLVNSSIYSIKKIVNKLLVNSLVSLVFSTTCFLLCHCYCFCYLMLDLIQITKLEKLKKFDKKLSTSPDSKNSWRCELLIFACPMI